MVTLAALVRTMCPELSVELLENAVARGDPSWLLHVEPEASEK